jgi:hypothetical protein
MRFLVFDGEVINVGSIQDINFESPPEYSGSATDGGASSSENDFSDEGHAPARKPFASPPHDSAVGMLSPDRARILVLGRSEPLETSDPQRIARLRELWRSKRAVGA